VDTKIYHCDLLQVPRYSDIALMNNSYFILSNNKLTHFHDRHASFKYSVSTDASTR
jgi:hypothetical protein